MERGLNMIYPIKSAFQFAYQMRSNPYNLFEFAQFVYFIILKDRQINQYFL
jgi:hypothetical protein